MSLIHEVLVKSGNPVSEEAIARDVWSDWCQMDEQRVKDGRKLLELVVNRPSDGHVYEVVDILSTIHFVITEGPDFETSDDLVKLVVGFAREHDIEHLESTSWDF